MHSSECLFIKGFHFNENSVTNISVKGIGQGHIFLFRIPPMQNHYNCRILKNIVF